MTNRPAWTEQDKEHAFTLYAQHGKLRAAHRALREELSQRGAETAPAWNTFLAWAEEGEWEARKAKVAAKAAAKTDSALATLTARRLGQIGAAIDHRLAKPEGLLRKAAPKDVAKFIELENRLAGGGLSVPEDGVLVINLNPRKPEQERP